MDPSKSVSAPPSEWSGEKVSMGQAPPPPYYQDNVQQGYPQPGPGYPQPGPGYPQGYGYPPQYAGAGYGQNPGQQATVTVQPTVYVSRGPLANPVNDYMCYSIFTLLCCCLPLGIAALIYSIYAREANHSGDQQGAERSSRMARTLNHVGLGLGIGTIVLTIIYAAVMVSMVN